MCSLPQSDREYLAELHRIVAALDARYEKIEALMLKLLAALKARPAAPRPRSPHPLH